MPTGPIDPNSVLSLDELADRIAEISGADRGQVGPETRLVFDLDFDSLAIAELLSTLVSDFGATPKVTGISRERWFTLSVRELYQESFVS